MVLICAHMSYIVTFVLTCGGGDSSRAEKIADKASYNIPFGRQLIYTLRVLKARLRIPVLEAFFPEVASSRLLPTPLAKTRLIEVSDSTIPFSTLRHITVNLIHYTLYIMWPYVDMVHRSWVQ